MNFSKVKIINEKQNFSPAETDKDFVIHSKLRFCEKKDGKTALSVKTVLSGVERYTINQKKHVLVPGHFLLVATDQDMEISFNEKNVAEGCCFYFDQKYLNQFSGLSMKGEEWSLDNPFGSEQEPALLSTKYRIESDGFGQFLTAAIREIGKNDNVRLTDDFFITMAGLLYQHQYQVGSKVNRLKSLKLATRQELYERVMIVRDFIEDQPESQKLPIQRLAQIAALSEVQLHRAFKNVMGQTPHQYIIERKMEKAAGLLRNGRLTVSEIAFELGFADLPSFSKTFKKHFGVSPMTFLAN